MSIVETVKYTPKNDICNSQNSHIICLHETNLQNKPINTFVQQLHARWRPQRLKRRWRGLYVNVRKHDWKKQQKIVVNAFKHYKKEKKRTENEEKRINKTEPVVNRGTGAGGSNTNKNGLPYEALTDLKSEYTVISSDDKHSKNIKFCATGITFKMTKQSRLFKCMDKHVDKQVVKGHGCKNPDECYIDEASKTIFILEKKFQQVSGSVCEKIQTSDFKIWQYNRTFPEYKIVYLYCLSDWFKANCKAELEYLNFKKVPVFWGNDKNYKSKVIDFMNNYK